MTNEEKSIIYDECLRESDYLQRRNSKLKSEYVGNIPPDAGSLLRVPLLRSGDRKVAFKGSDRGARRGESLWLP